MVLENYESKTLWLLSPLILVNEILLTVYSMIDGWLLAKIKSYGYLFRNLELIRSKRKAVQQTRVVRDKDLITKFSYKLSFAERDNMVIRKIINPIYRIYNSVLIRLL
ncbi:MAG: hypothetical protein NTY75_04840, partial [Candidatus Shapirobacteria bacterium]|nr:hypothetical protein [Candidatus Shapirobacteria bacterium]